MEGPIWRPNSFTVEAWDNLGREEQIRWWEAQETRSPPPEPSKGVEAYLKGTITRAELPTIIFERLTLTNVNEFLTTCPADVLELLRMHAYELPADGDDEGWGKLISIQGVCYAPWVTKEEIRESQLDSARQFRQGVQVFRSSDRR